MKKHAAFTLIELLIVVAIIAILAAIAVPNFLEAQVRSKVSRAQSDMRSLATAIEAYRVDTNTYPCANQNNDYYASDGTLLAVNSNCNTGAIKAQVMTNVSWGDGASWRMAFSIAPGLFTLTTPTAYITSYPPDPFARTRGLIFGYNNTANSGWMVWSYGPDGDESDGGQVGEGYIANVANLNPRLKMNNYQGKNSWDGNSWDGTYGKLVYHPALANPTLTLLTAGYTYDSTNGTRSFGDIYRVKQ